MLEIMTTAGEGTGRTQPMNGLDGLLSLPGKAGKATKCPPAHTGISSFEQILTEDMQSLPRSKASSSPPVDDDKPALELIIGLATSREAQTPHAAAKKAVKENGESLPPVAADPNILISLLTAAPFGTVQETNITPADEGTDDKLPLGEAAEKLLLHKIVKQELPPRTAGVGQADKETPPVNQGAAVPPLTPAAENITSQAAAVPASVYPEPFDVAQDILAEGIVTFDKPRADSAHPERLRGDHQRLSALPSPLVEKPEPGIVKANEVENTPNRAAAPETTIIDEPAKITAAEKPAAALPKMSGRERAAIITAALQYPTQEMDKSATDAPPTRTMGIAPPPPSPSAHLERQQGHQERLTVLQSTSGAKPEPGFMVTKEAENITNQTAVLETTISDGQAKAAVAEKQAITSPDVAGRERAASILTGMQATLQNPVREMDKPAADAPPSGKFGLAPSLTPAADKIPHQAAVSTAIIAPPEKTTVPGRQAAETAAEASMEPEAALPKTIPALLAKKGSDEFLASQGAENKDFVLGDKGKPHVREQFTIPETPATMGVNANRAAPLSKGQDAAAPTPSLLAQVAEQLPEAISKGSGRIRISLEPENLGKLDMDIVIRENKVQIVLTAENRTVQQTLQGNVEQLKDALRQQGLEVNSFNVLLQNGQKGQGDPAGANLFWSGYNHSAADNKGRVDDGLPLATVPFLPGQNLKNGADGINIFI